MNKMEYQGNQSMRQMKKYIKMRQNQAESWEICNMIERVMKTIPFTYKKEQKYTKKGKRQS